MCKWEEKYFRRTTVMEGELSELKEQLAARDVSPALAYKPTCPMDHDSTKSSKILAIKTSSLVIFHIWVFFVSEFRVTGS